MHSMVEQCQVHLSSRPKNSVRVIFLPDVLVWPKPIGPLVRGLRLQRFIAVPPGSRGRTAHLHGDPCNGGLDRKAVGHPSASLSPLRPSHRAPRRVPRRVP